MPYSIGIEDSADYKQKKKEEESFFLRPLVQVEGYMLEVKSLESEVFTGFITQIQRLWIWNAVGYG